MWAARCAYAGARGVSTRDRPDTVGIPESNLRSSGSVPMKSPKTARKMWIAAGITLGALIIVSGLIVQPSLIRRVPFTLPEASLDTWEAILSNPRPISVRTFSTGTMKTDLSGILNLEHPAATDIEDTPVDLPVNVSIVRHAERGAYLVDGGLDASYVHNPFGTMRGLIVERFLGKGSQEPGQDTASLLDREQAAIQGVFLTHLHMDHTAGLVDLPKDIPYVVGENERYVNFRFIIQGDHLAGVPELQEIAFDKGVDLAPLGTAVDLFGDGSFWAIRSPGHSAGHVLYFVNGVEEQVLLTGDACNTLEQFSTGIGPGFYSSDVAQAQASMDRIIRFKNQHPQVALSFGHDQAMLR
ncbi:MAG: MBL fold metallo-hydrolase [Alphaproteobacteria bacterium]|nr:MBL fold metallo-hydrolase [Alphaproteobacteria bacterium]